MECAGRRLTCLDGEQVRDPVQVRQAVLGLGRLQLGLSLDSNNLEERQALQSPHTTLSLSPDLRLILDEDDSLLVPGVGVQLAGLTVALVGGRLVAGLVPVLCPAPLHHPRPVLLPVHPPAGLVQGVLPLPPSLRGAAGGGARHLGRGRQLGGAAEPDVLTESRVHRHSQLQPLVRRAQW